MAHARSAEQAMPPGLTPDAVGRLAERERPGHGDAHQCRNPSRSRRAALTHRVKGGIARVSWLGE
ncbi:MAG: hypothetical protein J2P37_17140 [Ktedonobacteraceae bacterium]|nr:hypothetical protein [Ktedonobacteraceae bacterium]